MRRKRRVRGKKGPAEGKHAGEQVCVDLKENQKKKIE